MKQEGGDNCQSIYRRGDRHEMFRRVLQVALLVSVRPGIESLAVSLRDPPLQFYSVLSLLDEGREYLISSL